MDGDLYCWGRNAFDPPEAGRHSYPTPERVESDQSFVSVGIGALTACALTDEGRVYCWGDNYVGEMGRPPDELRRSDVPVPIVGDRTYRSLHMNGPFACAFGTDDLVYCWGANPYGQLGRGHQLSSYRPLPVLWQPSAEAGTGTGGR